MEMILEFNVKTLTHCAIVSSFGSSAGCLGRGTRRGGERDEG